MFKLSLTFLLTVLMLLSPYIPPSRDSFFRYLGGHHSIRNTPTRLTPIPLGITRLRLVPRDPRWNSPVCFLFPLSSALKWVLAPTKAPLSESQLPLPRNLCVCVLSSTRLSSGRGLSVPPNNDEEGPVACSPFSFPLSVPHPTDDGLRFFPSALPMRQSFCALPRWAVACFPRQPRTPPCLYQCFLLHFSLFSSLSPFFLCSDPTYFSIFLAVRSPFFDFCRRVRHSFKTFPFHKPGLSWFIFSLLWYFSYSIGGSPPSDFPLPPPNTLLFRFRALKIRYPISLFSFPQNRHILYCDFSACIYLPPRVATSANQSSPPLSIAMSWRVLFLFLFGAGVLLHQHHQTKPATH